MVKYIYRDLVTALGYLPYGLALGIPLSAALVLIAFFVNRKQKRQNFVPLIAFGLYLAILLVITFLSRESGSSPGVMDLQLFSTWGINTRNNAYVVENVLLFIPYGFLCSCAFVKLRNFFSCMLFGALTSMSVEYLQLVTARGYFQIDDILTNTLGSVVGYLMFLLLVGKSDGSRCHNKEEDTSSDADSR